MPSIALKICVPTNIDTNNSILSTNTFNALPTTINVFPKTFPSVVANSLIAVLFLEKKNSKLPNCFVNTLKKPTET